MYVVVPRGAAWVPLAVAGGTVAGLGGAAVAYGLGMDFVAGWLGSGVGWLVGVFTAWTIVKTEPSSDEDEVAE